METPSTQSEDIANAITVASFTLGFAVAGSAFGMCWYLTSLVHQAVPWVR